MFSATPAILNYSILNLFNSKLKIPKLKIGKADNSKLKTQNSKSAKPTIQNSKLKIQNSTMIFLKLFIVFTKIGTFNFGGGYAMLSLIHNEVVVKNAWLSNAEFTDIVAISQSTPGPIGINAATYAGYVAVLNQDYPEWLAAVGSVIASLSIIWLPFVIMILISRYLINHKDSKIVKDIFAGLRPTIVGLIAAAAVLLMNCLLYTSDAADDVPAV